MESRLVAFIGYGRTGKDTAANYLLERDWTRCNFADLIKEELDDVIRETFGFSAFTEIDSEKAQIRPVLEAWGHARYDALQRMYFHRVDHHLEQGRSVVNTRLVRPDEAEKWLKRGGKIILIERPGANGLTEWERDEFSRLQQYLWDKEVPYGSIANVSTVEYLHSELEYELGFKN